MVLDASQTAISLADLPLTGKLFLGREFGRGFDAKFLPVWNPFFMQKRRTKDLFFADAKHYMK